MTKFMNCLLAGTVVLLAASCASTEHETSAPRRGSRTEFTPPSGRGQRVSGATVLNTVRTAHVFSNAAAPDAFILQLRGPRILTGRLHLLVLTNHGDTLHHEVLPARRLQDPRAVTVRDQEISVLRDMNNFFGPSHFVSPAVSATARRPAAISAEAWNSVRTNPEAVGFEYPAADGSTHRLVYAPQPGRALVLAD